MTLYIMDPGLQSNMGHHVNTCEALVHEARNRKIPTRLLANKEIDPAIKERLRAADWFDYGTYVRVSDDPISWWMERFSAGQEITYRNLQLLHDVKPNDIILWPSCNEFQFLALVRWAQTCFKPATCPNIFVRFGYDFGLTRDGKHSYDAALYRFVNTILVESFRPKFHLGTSDYRHTEQGNATLKAKLGVWPDIMPVPLLSDPRKPEKLVVGFVGHQRLGKGALFIPPLVKGVKELGLEYYVHSSGPEADFTDDWKEIEVDRTAYTPSEYQDMLQKIDLMVLPYNRRAYAEMPSGIVCECFANAIPMVVPDNCQPGEIVSSNNVGYAYKDNRIMEAIKLVVTNYEMYKKNALVTQKEWARLNGPDKFLDVILNEANANTYQKAV